MRIIRSILFCHFVIKITSCQKSENSDFAVFALAKKITNPQDLLELTDLFMVGIKLVIFSMQYLSNQMKKLHSCSLVNIWFGLLDKPPQKFDYKDLNCMAYLIAEFDTKQVSVWIETDLPFASFTDQPAQDKIFLSIGKTSTLTIEEQLCWKSTQDIIETVFYCHIDTMLTLSLVKFTKDIFEIIISGTSENYPFCILNLPSGKKVVYYYPLLLKIWKLYSFI